jgi:hypothetical protein
MNQPQSWIHIIFPSLFTHTHTHNTTKIMTLYSAVFNGNITHIAFLQPVFNDINYGTTSQHVLEP